MFCKYCNRKMHEIPLADECGNLLYVAEYECRCGGRCDVNGDWTKPINLTIESLIQEINDLTEEEYKQFLERFDEYNKELQKRRDRTNA